MSAPQVTPILFAPERIEDAENFAGARSVFLAALPNFRTQSNALATYLNALPIQDRTNDYGRLFEPADPSAQVPQLPTQPTAGNTNIQWTVRAEDSVEATAALPVYQNLVAAYADFFSMGSFVVDGSRPVIPALPDPPSMADFNNEAAFEADAIAFFAAVKDYADKLADFSLYVFNKVYPGPDEDYGLITESITTTADYGAVP